MSEPPRFSMDTWSNLFDQSGEILLVVDIETARIVEANDTASDLLEDGDESLLDTSIVDITGFANETAWRDHLPPLSDEQQLGEITFHKADGDTVPVEASVSRVRSGGAEYALVLARDLTERKAREAELERYQERAEQYFETAGNVMVVLNRDGTVHRINERGSERLGYDRSELEGSNWFEQVVPEPIEGEIDDIFDAFWQDDAESIQTHTNDVETKDGEAVFFKWHNTALTDESGAVTRVLASGIDITERKTYEEELDEANTVLRTIVESMPMGVLVEDADREIIMANDSLTQVLDVPLAAEELIGQDCAAAAENLKDLFADPESFVKEIDRRIADREPVHNEILELADGRVLERDYIPYTLPDGPANLWIYRDITERKERNREITRIRDFLDDVIDALPYPLYVLDTEDYEIERSNLEVGEQTGETCYAVSHQRNTPCPQGEVSFQCPLETVVETGEPMTVEHTHYDEAGNEYVHEVHAAPIFDEDGSVVQMVETLIDITARKEYEEQIREQRDNLEVLNQVLRHDIRNDLQLVTAYADLLADRLDEQQDYVETIHENARHAIELTTTARDMADVWLSDRDDHGQISLKSTLESELDEARAVHTDAVITVDGEVPDVRVRADDMLRSVFHNLLQNGVRHNDKNVPEVTVSVERGDESVRVQVADNGPGMPDDRKESIFGKGEKGLDSSGTGLGLYLVQTLVESYGGTVEVVDNDPEGSVFVVELQTVSDDE